MQGNKKCTDGFSDTSSIGSVLDEADREVSSLTDRAFRSLCLSEDPFFHDSDLALSQDPTGQVLGAFPQGTVSHTHRKSGIWSQLPASQGTEHAGWAATFQQLPKYVQGEEKYPKSSPPLTPAQRRLEVPVSGLRSGSKPISKVSSLIKSFDRPESQRCDSRPPPSKPPVLKTTPKFAPLPDSGVNFCFDSAFLTVRRVPAEVSNTHQNQPSRKHGGQESPKNPDMACPGSGSFLPGVDTVTSSAQFPSPPHKPAKGDPGRGKEWAPKGTFLHSENSAFESWNAHQPKLLERKDTADPTPDTKAPKLYQDAPLLREPQPPEHKVSPCQVRASCGQEESRLAAGALSTSGPWGLRDPGSQAFATEGKAASSEPAPQVKPSQPPWRKPKLGKGGKESLQDGPEGKQQSPRREPLLYTKHNPQGQFPEQEAPDMPGDPSQQYSPPFNISKLLTPIIPTKHGLDASTSQPPDTTPSPPGQLNGYQEKEPGECPSRDSYKSKAPSLLFNLKDVRKRVKSTYSPSPLLKGLDEKSRGKADGQQEALNDLLPLPNGLQESPPHELAQDSPADAPPASYTGTQQDPAARPSETSAGSYAALGSPPTPAQAPCCVNGEAVERSCDEKVEAAEDGEAEVGPARPGFRPDSRNRRPRKHLSLKLTCGLESEAVAVETQQLQNGLPRSISQDTEAERELGLPNMHPMQKFSPGPLSPEEEDVFYSDSQSDFTPGFQSKAKFSTSSSDQSFASFDEPQKPWFAATAAESQRDDRRSDGSAGDGEEKEKGDVGGSEAQPQAAAAAGNRKECVQEHRQREALLQREGERLPAGRQREASTEEVDFRGSQPEVVRDKAPVHAKDPIPSPPSVANKHILFAIKDNTLRATPVIKPVMLPLLRAMSSEGSLSGSHKGDDSPRPAWAEDAQLGAPESQGRRGNCTPTDEWGTHLKPGASHGLEDQDTAQQPRAASMEASQPAHEELFPDLPLVGEGDRRKVPLEVARKASWSKSRSAMPWEIPTIALPDSDSDQATQPRPQPPGTCWEEQARGFQGHFLAAPRAGPPGRRLHPGEAAAVAASPNPSSQEEGSAYSPAASSLWDDTSQAPSEPADEPPRASPWAGPGQARVTRREDLTHALVWETDGSDPQFEGASEDLRTLSPRGALRDAFPSPAGPPEKPESPAQPPPPPPPPPPPERAAGKPPAVPPKTEKALRRAKKLASKRRKSEQVREKPAEPGDATPGATAEDWARAERRPPSPGDAPRPRCAALRSLPPPAHRHSVSGFPEPVGRWPGGPQALTPLPPYPATQKVLQDPQSGEYFVFDLPLQVKIKTFYDPETGNYVRVPIQASDGGSPEPPPADALAAPYVLYPSCRPVPVTALRPLRCSSQLAAPTFLRQAPRALEGSRARPQSAHDVGLQLSAGPRSEPAPQAATAAQRPRGLPRSPVGAGAEAPDLGIISTDDLEDFATEGIS
nr:cardiac-enriched FHL2-interacting protein [Oryctolagus cuniculus]XP_051679660.1 cardiac-enriched FHL2-interacting protein [Oryctolagus cuniculus]